jgi:N-acyl-D-amino-acid deacylase
MANVLIKNPTIYDGSGSKPFVADVLIDGHKIAAIGKLDELVACDVIDGSGLALAPGFIDTHSHSDLEVFRNPKMQHVIRQGITTEVVGQDGSSVVPVFDAIVDELADNMAPLAGVVDRPYWWRSFADYLEEVRKADPYTRVEGLIGHGTVRMCIMGNDIRKPADDELAKMKDLIAKCMEEGAKGMSLGLIYPPGSYADTDEIIELCKVVAQYDGIVMVHMRNEQDKLLDSIDEMARVARESGVRLHISHLKALGYRNWGKIKDALERIYQLREEGLDVTFDQYPYTAACTGLKVLVPMWAYEGGEKGFQRRLDDHDEYSKILDEVNKTIEARGGADRILIATVASDENAWMSGKNLKEISERLHLEPGPAALRILKVEGPSVVAIYFSISEEDVAMVMKSPLQGICTDGIVGAHPHPRAYGSFPRVLGYYCRELGLMPLEEAIRKMTMEPARRLRLWDRGLIREGMSADLVLFDPETVCDKNTFLDPKVYPCGIKAVWVKGELRFVEHSC